MHIHICKNYQCQFCINNSSNVEFYLENRFLLIDKILFKIKGDIISLNKLIIEFLIELIKMSKKLKFCCCECKKRDYPSIVGKGCSENQIINLAYRIRLNKNSNKWKNHKVKIKGTKIVHI